MARTTDEIESQILDNVAADTTLGPLLTSSSKRAIYRLWAFIQATAIEMHEQLIDIFTANVESVAAMAAPSTANWLQNQILNFQYSPTNPQIIQLVNFAPQYPVVDPTLLIISRCSVTTSLSNQVVLKVATGNPPGPLSSPQIAALTAFLNPPNGIGVAGINYIIQSLAADQIYIQANIFYQGQYSSVIQVNVIAAITAYLAAIPFNGVVKLSDLEGAVKAVAGVNDVVFQNVSARAASVGFGSGTPLVVNQNEMSRIYATVAGYIVGETTGGQDLPNTLTFTAE